MNATILTKLKPTDLIPFYGWHDYNRRTSSIEDNLFDVEKTSGTDYLDSMRRLQENRLITKAVTLAPIIGAAAYFITKYTV